MYIGTDRSTHLKRYFEADVKSMKHINCERPLWSQGDGGGLADLLSVSKVGSVLRGNI